MPVSAELVGVQAPEGIEAAKNKEQKILAEKKEKLFGRRMKFIYFYRKFPSLGNYAQRRRQKPPEAAESREPAACRELARRRPLIAAARQKPRAAGRPQAVVSAKLVSVQALKGIESVKSQSSPRPPEAEFLGELIYKSIINSNYYDLSAW